jgi:hypothetical protein
MKAMETVPSIADMNTPPSTLIYIVFGDPSRDTIRIRTKSLRIIINLKVLLNFIFSGSRIILLIAHCSTSECVLVIYASSYRSKHDIFTVRCMYIF